MLKETCFKKYGPLAYFAIRFKGKGKPLPWAAARGTLAARCRFAATPQQIKLLFFIDGATKFKRPIVERIDERKHWDIKNIRWVDRRFGKSPWSKARSNIKNRCENKNDPKYKYYGGRGIRCQISATELKILFYRDSGFIMKQPSVDRINNDGNYCYENVRWLEMVENRKRRWDGKK